MKNQLKCSRYFIFLPYEKNKIIDLSVFLKFKFIILILKVYLMKPIFGKTIKTILYLFFKF
jgi:hypothetical protein